MKNVTMKGKNIPCSWIGRINAIKMFMFPPIFYRSNSISIKISIIFSNNWKKLQKCIWNHKWHQISETILRKKSTTGRHSTWWWFYNTVFSSWMHIVECSWESRADHQASKQISEHWDYSFVIIILP